MLVLMLILPIPMAMILPNLTRHAENRLTVKVNCAMSTRGGATSAICGSHMSERDKDREMWFPLRGRTTFFVVLRGVAFDRGLKMTVGSERRDT
jgi:hypothetical protein